jgi:hypothetical protein
MPYGSSDQHFTVRPAGASDDNLIQVLAWHGAGHAHS